MRLNEKDMIKKVSDEVELNEYMVKKVIDTFWDIMLDEIRDGNCVALHGKGKFFVKLRKGHVLNIPQLGEAQRMDDYPIVTFVGSKQYGKQLRQDYKDGNVTPFNED